MSNRGKQVQAIEKRVSEANRNHAANTADAYLINFKTNFADCDRLRQFYNSIKFGNQNNHIEIQKHRFCRRLCTKERRRFARIKGKKYNFC